MGEGLSRPRKSAFTAREKILAWNLDPVEGLPNVETLYGEVRKFFRSLRREEFSTSFSSFLNSSWDISRDEAMTEVWLLSKSMLCFRGILY